MKKILTIVVLALVLCLGLSVALAASYTAKYNDVYDGTDAAILNHANWSVYINGSEWAIPASDAIVQYDDVSATGHAEHSWVTITYTFTNDRGDPVDVEAHGVAVRNVNKHVPGAVLHRDEKCHLYYDCTVCGAKLYVPRAGQHDEFVYEPNDYVTSVAKASVNHVYQPKLVDDPTCFNYGEYENRCIHCNALEGDGEGTVITHHRAVREWVQDPVCSNKGVGKLVYYCIECDKYLDYDPATGLPLNKMTDKTYATYTSAQVFTPDTDELKAKVRGWFEEDYDVKFVSGAGIDGHVMDAWVTLYAQSCYHPETDIRWCVVCQQYYETKENLEKPALDPVYVVQDVKCNVAGTSQLTYKCILCNGKAVGHTARMTVNAALADDNFKDKVNIIHNFDYSNATKIAALHQNANCTLKGRDVYRCTREAQHLAAIEPPAAGELKGTHYNYMVVDIPALGHQMTDWELIVEPGAGDNVTGFWRRACTRLLPAGTYPDGAGGTITLAGTTPCGCVERWFHSFPPSSACEEHVPVEYDRIAPTCTEDGVAFMMCEVCLTKLDDVVLPATDHTWKEEVIVAATCSENGVALKTCTECGKMEKVELAKKGHTWDDGVVTTEPTTEKAGVKTYTCKVCKETKTEEIAKKEKEAKYDIEGLKYNNPVATGTAKLEKGTTALKKAYARVTFFLANGDCMIQIVEVEEDGTFKAGAIGNFVHISVVIVDVDDAYGADEAIEHAHGNGGIKL